MDEIEVYVNLAIAGAGQEQRQEAFYRLVLSFQDMAYGYAYAILGDPELAQDAAQEAFIQAYRHLDQLREKKAFPAWLRQIVHSQCHRLLRKRTPAQAIEGLPEVVSGQPGPPEFYERQELCDRIRAEINALPETQRVATVLYYINGYSQDQVANFMQTSTNAVKKQIQYARSQLQERMMDMVKDDLHRHRPSRSRKFFEAVKAFTSLKAAADDSQVGMVEMMLLDGMDVNSQDEDGLTLLHWAARSNNLELAEFLIERGAKTGLTSKAGKTPLQDALERGYTDLIDLLRR